MSLKCYTDWIKSLGIARHNETWEYHFIYMEQYMQYYYFGSSVFQILQCVLEFWLYSTSYMASIISNIKTHFPVYPLLRFSHTSWWQVFLVSGVCTVESKSKQSYPCSVFWSLQCTYQTLRVGDNMTNVCVYVVDVIIALCVESKYTCL